MTEGKSDTSVREEYPPMHPDNVRSARDEARRIKVFSTDANNEIAEDNVQADKAMEKSLAKKKESAVQVADKLIGGKGLTPAQTTKLEKEPGFKLLVRQEFKRRGENPPKLYVDAVMGSVEASIDPALDPIDRHRGRRHITDSIGKVEGIDKVTVAQGGGNKIFIMFPSAFNGNERNKIEIGIRSSSGADTDDPCSPVSPVHNSGMRDSEWENPSSDLCDPVLGDDAGETG